MVFSGPTFDEKNPSFRKTAAWSDRDMRYAAHVELLSKSWRDGTAVDWSRALLTVELAGSQVRVSELAPGLCDGSLSPEKANQLFDEALNSVLAELEAGLSREGVNYPVLGWHETDGRTFIIFHSPLFHETIDAERANAARSTSLDQVG